MVVHRQEFSVSSDTMTIPVTIWSPDGNPANTARPLLVVHDGPEYEQRAGLIDKMAWWIDEGSIKPHNIALLAPDDMGNQYRLAHYAASDEYDYVLTELILPELKRRAPVDGSITGMGASMGALALLRSASAFNALYLQSASIHHPDYADKKDDEQEYKDMYAAHGMEAGYERVKQFVEKARNNLVDGDRLTISLTCGDESNYKGNKALYYILREQGHTMLDGHIPGMQHYFESWGSNLDPSLRDLLLAVSGLHRHR